MIWNSSATKMTVQNPPTSQNFKVNSKVVANFEDFEPGDGDQLADSLYQLQLSLRIGAEAAALVFQPAGSWLADPDVSMNMVQPNVDVIPEPKVHLKSVTPASVDLLSDILGAL